MFDLSSDLHLDFWVDPSSTDRKQTMHMKNMLDKLVPENNSKTIVLAGDIGHYNRQNALFLKLLKERYENVLWVHGNHDLYMISGNIAKTYNYDSFSRLAEMAKMASDIGAIRLDGNIVEIDGIKFGGAGGWYDGQYGVLNHGKSPEDMKIMWYDIMNDSNFILKNGRNIDYEMVFAEEHAKLLSVVNNVDVMVSHVPPDWSRIEERFRRADSSFWYFNGDDLLKQLGDRKTWVFGHVHTQRFYKHYTETMMYANPMGYPGENGVRMESLERRAFATINPSDQFG